MSQEAAQKALDKAKIALMSSPNTTFFSTVCISLRIVWSEQEKTAATDGHSIFINPNFLLSLSPAEQLFLLLHETLHVVFLHMLRLGDYDLKKWNKAADYVINAMLIDLGYTMPKGGLYKREYSGPTTEAVYALLPDPPPGDTYIPDLYPSKKPVKEAREEINDILVRAAIQTEMRKDKAGSIPGCVQRYIDELRTPKLPWHRITRNYLTAMVKGAYSFRKPNRRYFPDQIMPTPYSEGLSNIAVAIDASGSVTQFQFSDFMGKVKDILKSLRPEWLTLVQFDTAVSSVDKLHSLSDANQVKFTGGGGTRIEPVMRWAEENKPDLLIVFTDGIFTIDCEDPKVPIIWIIHTRKEFTPPFGKVIFYSPPT